MMNYLPSAVFIAQLLVGSSKQLKQIIQTEHNIVKATSRLFTSVAEDLLGTTEKQIQVVARTWDRRIASPTR